MGDPGLHSKFIESQQQDAFSPTRCEKTVDNYTLSLHLDKARIVEQLTRARHRHHQEILRRALNEVESQLIGRQ